MPIGKCSSVATALLRRVPDREEHAVTDDQQRGRGARMSRGQRQVPRHEHRNCTGQDEQIASREQESTLSASATRRGQLSAGTGHKT